jgi:hypothetical protein
MLHHWSKASISIAGTVVSTWRVISASAGCVRLGVAMNAVYDQPFSKSEKKKK